MSSFYAIFFSWLSKMLFDSNKLSYHLCQPGTCLKNKKYYYVSEVLKESDLTLKHLLFARELNLYYLIPDELFSSFLEDEYTSYFLSTIEQDSDYQRVNKVDYAVNGIYRHHKGSLYALLCHAFDITNGSINSIYSEIGMGDRNIWCRHFKEFFEVIDKQENLYRFKKLK